MDDDVDKGRFVAIKLGLPSERCAGGYNTTWYDHWVCCKHGSDYPHDLLPDFLSPAGADLLLRTLHRRHIDIEIHHEWLTLYGGSPEREVPVHFNGDDYKPALLDVAYNLLKALEEK
jgi:hypothetical protein